MNTEKNATHDDKQSPTGNNVLLVNSKETQLTGNKRKQQTLSGTVIHLPTGIYVLLFVVFASPMQQSEIVLLLLVNYRGPALVPTVSHPTRRPS